MHNIFKKTLLKSHSLSFDFPKKQLKLTIYSWLQDVRPHNFEFRNFPMCDNTVDKHGSLSFPLYIDNILKWWIWLNVETISILQNLCLSRSECKKNLYFKYKSIKLRKGFNLTSRFFVHGIVIPWNKPQMRETRNWRHCLFVTTKWVFS